MTHLFSLKKKIQRFSVFGCPNGQFKKKKKNSSWLSCMKVTIIAFHHFFSLKSNIIVKIQLYPRAELDFEFSVYVYICIVQALQAKYLSSIFSGSIFLIKTCKDFLDGEFYKLFFLFQKIFCIINGLREI